MGKEIEREVWMIGNDTLFTPWRCSVRSFGVAVLLRRQKPLSNRRSVNYERILFNSRV